MAKLSPLDNCDSCGSEIWGHNVLKVVAIPKAVGHVALIYKCSACGVQAKAAMPVELWKEHEHHSSAEEKAKRDAIALAEIELEPELTVEFLRSYWSSLRNPPKIERGKHEKKHRP